MPIVRIEGRRPRSPQEVQALIDAVHAAQLEALKIPPDDKQIVYVEHRPEHFAVPPGKSEHYLFVQILMFPGRSVDAKRALYRGIVDRLVALGVPASDVLIVLQSPPLENWGLRGGQAGCDIDLGFKVDV